MKNNSKSGAGDGDDRGRDRRDIHIAQLSGMSPVDVEHLRMFTMTEALLMIIRCPKRSAREFHGIYPAKRMVTKTKSSWDGLVHHVDGRKEVSDYDLMCVYRLDAPGHYDKIFFSGIDSANPRSPLVHEATEIMRKVNSGLLSRFQHGAQDDYGIDPGKHPGVKSQSAGARSDHFAAFDLGQVTYLANPAAAKTYYARLGLIWPYDGDGRLVPSLVAVSPGVR